MKHLPMRPVHVEGEDLHSVIERAARLNHMTPARVGLNSVELSRRSTSERLLELTGAALGMTRPEMIATTLDVYPIDVVGHPHRTTARTWRMRLARWRCPRCTALTGIYMRDWRLALHPLCTRCPALLCRADSGWECSIPDRRAVATQQQIANTLSKVRLGVGQATEFRRLYELVTLVALTADDHWPLLLGWEGELRQQHGGQSHDWMRSAPTTPADAAIVVLECARALSDENRYRRLVEEGWERVLAAPIGAALRRASGNSLRALLPAEVKADAADSASAEPDARFVQEALARELRSMAIKTGLQPRHVPGWHLRAGEGFAPTCRESTDRSEIALATHMLLSSTSPTAADELRARQTLETVGSWTVTRQLVVGEGINAMPASAIRDFARSLVRDGLVDFAERRRLLTTASGLCSRLQANITRWGVVRASDDDVAAWTWITLTQGPPWHGLAIEAARELDASLDPEQRLTLYDIAVDYLREASELSIEGMTARWTKRGIG